MAIDYGLSFVEPGQGKDDDKVLNFDGFDVYIDPDSEPFLEGAIVDYVTGLNESGFKITNPNAAKLTAPTGEMAEKVQHVLDQQVNPAIRNHGGFVSLVDLKDDIAYLRFGGGCQGCGMVDVTLKQGVEVMIKEAIPELKGVMDITDHASGENPYYS
jgi:Fe/S biogenesis protein NfuA